MRCWSWFVSVCACVSSKGLVILIGGNLFKTVMETPAESSAITATFFFFTGTQSHVLLQRALSDIPADMNRIPQDSVAEPLTLCLYPENRGTVLYPKHAGCGPILVHK